LLLPILSSYKVPSGFDLSFSLTDTSDADWQTAKIRVIVPPEMAASCPGISGRIAQVKRLTRLSTGQRRDSE
jgi:hypothetical protein